MSSDRSPETTDPADTSNDAVTTDRDQASLVAELEMLRAETDRLRASYVRARRSQYRQTALWFALLGLLATAGGILVPAMRTILLALGGTGLFAAGLTWLITPEQFVSASVGSAVYDAVVDTHDRLQQELGLTDERVYVPTGDATTGVRLFVPQRTSFRLPDRAALDSLFIVTDDESMRGVALHPTGESLFQEFEAALDGALADTPGAIVAQARAAIIDQFEIATNVEMECNEADGRLSLRVTESAYGDLTRVDHPVVSTVAVALARGLDRSVRVDLTDADGAALATLRWEPPEPTPDAPAGDADSETAAPTA